VVKTGPIAAFFAGREPQIGIDWQFEGFSGKAHTFSRRRSALVISDTTALRYEQSDPDVRLMLKVRDDDAAAFEELMLRYQNRLVNILRHLVNDGDLAEDLGQEVFLRVYRARKRYVPGAKFSTWLFTIANNVALNALRSKSRRREVNLAANESGPMGANPMEKMLLAASSQMPVRQIDKSEMRAMVREALGALNQRQRMAVLLNKFEDMSYADIAETMELSPQAIKSLLARARENLKLVIQPYLSDGERPKVK
jgi:RNA polymerase sigma-70 factor (ECF subfamily)